MRTYFLIVVLALTGCYSVPSGPQQAEILAIQNSVKQEIATLGSMAILNAPWSKVDVQEIQSRVETCKRRIDQLTSKVLGGQ